MTATDLQPGRSYLYFGQVYRYTMRSGRLWLFTHQGRPHLLRANELKYLQQL